MNQYNVSTNTITCVTNGLYNLIAITIFWLIFVAANIFVHTRGDTNSLFASVSLLHIGLAIFLIVITAALTPAYNNRKNKLVLAWQFNIDGLLLPQNMATLTHYKSPVLISWEQIKAVSIVQSLHEKGLGEHTYSRNMILIYLHQNIPGTMLPISTYKNMHEQVF